jgi:hypothetical protein
MLKLTTLLTRIVSLNAAKANNTIQGELVNVNQFDIFSVSSYHKMDIVITVLNYR